MSTSSIVSELLAQISSGFFVVSAAATALWKADNIFSEAGRKLIYDRITNITNNPNDSELQIQIQQFLNTYYSQNISILAFVRNVLVFSILSLFIILCIYISQTKGLLQQLISDDFARSQFFSLFANNALIVLVVNYVGYSYYQFALKALDARRLRNLWKTLFAETILKMTLFIVLTGAMYILFALYRGSFLGRWDLALHAVAPTISGAIFFQNLSTVYLYSLAISSFPIFVVTFIELLVAKPRFAQAVQLCLFWLPFERKPIRAISVVFGLALFLFSFVAFGLVWATSLLT